ncbi:4460_t:CDS:2, partial [Ambispora leptoticha]
SQVKNNGVNLSHLDIQKRELIILRGITTSQINQALKANNPYPARVFLKVDNQEQDIPVFFRIKGSYLEVKGHFDNPKNGSDRPSFTATSYQLLDPHLQGKFTLVQATQQLPHFEQELAQIKQTRELLENHDQ